MGMRSVIAELTAQKIVRAVYSERQLEEVLIDFWFNHFNVFAGKGQTRIYLTEYEREAIRPHVLGKFRDLLGATAKSPAMLFYLDNCSQRRPVVASSPRAGSRMRQVEACPGRAATAASHARRIDQVRKNMPTGHQRELRPRADGAAHAGRRRRLHAAGRRQRRARVHGLDDRGPRDQRPASSSSTPRMHDRGEKVVLGHRIKAGGGMEDGEQVLDILAAHPSTAQFIATKLVRRFVADEPPAALVDARGRDVPPHGRRPPRGGARRSSRRRSSSRPRPYRAKVKTPFEFVVSAVRATGADVQHAAAARAHAAQLGMPLYFCQPPTGYKDTADAWVNSGALIGRMNFAARSGGEHGSRRRPGRSAAGSNQTDADTAVAPVLDATMRPARHASDDSQGDDAAQVDRDGSGLARVPAR